LANPQAEFEWQDLFDVPQRRGWSLLLPRLPPGRRMLRNIRGACRGEGYLYCFYRTQQQCQWTASGIGGCALNPRLLFPIKPRDS
jgi:hypothetical protein